MFSLKVSRCLNIFLIRCLHKEVRVRFAPSPTGHLHLGGLRTALYNYLFVKSHSGKFILRIEDTDQTRLIDGAVEELQQDLLWAGLKIDEGPGMGGENGPYIQSQRLDIYKAFGWEPPTYGHLPLLLNSDGTKLSKRQGDIKISHYREKGIFPLALINFISLSGGGFAKDQERGLKPKIYTFDQLAKQFDVKSISIHSGKLMPERLWEFNRLELQRQVEDEECLNFLGQNLQKIIQEKFDKNASKLQINVDLDYVKSILKWSANRINRLEDLVEKEFGFLWVLPSASRESNKESILLIQKLRSTLEKQDFSRDTLKKLLRSFSKENNITFSGLMMMLRGILSGLKEGPSVAEMIEILGKENTLTRLEMYIRNNKEQR